MIRFAWGACLKRRCRRRISPVQLSSLPRLFRGNLHWPKHPKLVCRVDHQNYVRPEEDQPSRPLTRPKTDPSLALVRGSRSRSLRTQAAVQVGRAARQVSIMNRQFRRSWHRHFQTSRSRIITLGCSTPRPSPNHRTVLGMDRKRGLEAHDRHLHCPRPSTQRGCKRGDASTEAIGPSIGGLSTKIHAVVDASSLPTKFPFDTWASLRP